MPDEDPYAKYFEPVPLPKRKRPRLDKATIEQLEGELARRRGAPRAIATVPIAVEGIEELEDVVAKMNECLAEASALARRLERARVTVVAWPERGRSEHA